MTPRLKPPADAESTPTTAPFPYGDGEVGDGLPAASARGVLRASASGSEGAGESAPTACPDCGAAAINGAGLFACTACPWRGSLR